jgi:DNA polymerase III sliding clamp (beta) subunit (PCNA family)
LAHRYNLNGVSFERGPEVLVAATDEHRLSLAGASEGGRRHEK